MTCAKLVKIIVFSTIPLYFDPESNVFGKMLTVATRNDKAK